LSDTDLLTRSPLLIRYFKRRLGIGRAHYIVSPEIGHGAVPKIETNRKGGQPGVDDLFFEALAVQESGTLQTLRFAVAVGLAKELRVFAADFGDLFAQVCVVQQLDGLLVELFGLQIVVQIPAHAAQIG